MIPRRNALIWLLLTALVVVAATPSTVGAATTYEVTIQSSKSVYVDEGTPTANMNTYDANYLRVGRGAEFGYRQQTFVEWSPIAQAQGGALPTGATVTGAKMRLYKDNTTGGSVGIYRPIAAWSETTLTWNNKPALFGKGGFPTAMTTLTLAATKGWVEISLPVSLIELWIDTPTQNYGISVMANWTALASMALRSDEYASYRPQLVLTYLGGPPPTPPPPPPTDTVPCVLTYAVDPPTPRVGQPVTVTVQGTDNQAMSYVAIMRGLSQLARRDAVCTSEISLAVSHTETATLPNLTYTLLADDLGDATARRVDIVVPVTGSGSAPAVTVTATWEIQEVVPERYRLIEGDGQTVTVTATASDPDGIQQLTISVNSVPHDFTYLAGATSVSESVTWTNVDRSKTHFSFAASARDREGLYATAPGQTHSIVRFSEIDLLWDYAFSFENYTKARLSWERMVQTFGADECWWHEGWDWKNPYALIWYHAGFKNLAAGGHCWGISTAVLELYQGLLLPGDLEPGVSTRDLDASNQYTTEYIEARHGGQLGELPVISAIDQYVTWVAAVTPHLDLLRDIQDDLRRDTPGLVAIREGGQGHVIVPWMTRRMSDGTTRIYMYDCNYTDGIRNPIADFNYFAHYPYLEMEFFNWQYAQSWDAATNTASSIWDDKLLYFDFEDALGNTRVRNDLGPALTAPSVTDHNMCGLIDALIGVFGGTGEVYFEDSAGRVTGLQNGILKEEIPGSFAIVPMGASTASQTYVLPAGVGYDVSVRGQASTEYTLGLIGSSSAIAVEDKAITALGVDRYRIEPQLNSSNIGLRVTPGVQDTDFTVRLVRLLEGRVQALSTNYIGREYILQGVSAGPGDDFAVHTDIPGDALIAVGHAGQPQFDVILRSTESADVAPPGTAYIPASVAEGIRPTAGTTTRVAPLQWATSAPQASTSVGAGESTQIRLYIGSPSYLVGSTRLMMDTSPIIRDDRTLLPIRFVAEPLGATVAWNSVEQKATIALGGTVIELWVGSNQARVNGNLRYIDPDNLGVVPILVPPGRTMMPVRFVAEALGCGVLWNQSLQEVTILHPAP